MRVIALCTKRAGSTVAKALGVQPLTSPPLEIESNMDYSVFEGFDVWYIRLHGHGLVKNLWYGEETPGSWIIGLSSEDVKHMDLRGTLVIAGTCYGLDSDFPKSFLKAGARGVVAGSGYNFASTKGRVVGPDRLAAWMIKGLKWGLSDPLAFWFAKGMTALHSWRAADRDALTFKLLERGDIT